MDPEQVKKYAGYREHRVNEISGGYNVLLNANEAGLDNTSGDWVTICDEHGTVCNHETRKKARLFLKTAEWCEECRSSQFTVRHAYQTPEGPEKMESTPCTLPVAKERAKKLVRKASTLEVAVFDPDGNRVWAPASPDPASVEFGNL